MDTKVTDRPPNGSVELYEQMMRMAKGNVFPFAVGVIESIATDLHVSASEKVQRICNALIACQLVGGDAEPEPPVPNYGRGDEGGQVVACPAHGAHPHENDGSGPLVCLDCPTCRPSSVE